MGDVGDLFNAKRQQDKARKERNLANADPGGWTRHTPYHWSRTLQGDRLDYWPSRNKWQWRGKVYTGDVQGFIRKREEQSDD